MFENHLWRVVLHAEDGDYVLRDSLANEDAANRYADSVEDNYGEGQEIWIESYDPFYYNSPFGVQ
jgi:hypothetical protein